MDFLPLNLASPALNLALDEALLEHAETTGDREYLRIWESPTYCVVLGRNCPVADDVWVDHCAADGVPLLRRASGGGTVLLGPGCINYSLVLRFDRSPLLPSIPSSFDLILGVVATALAKRGVRRAGPSDLVVGDRKICGNAQRRQRTHLLHHGSILNRFDIGRIERYLRLPRRQPEYRRGRPHDDFLANLEADPGEIARALELAWAAAPARCDWPERLTAERSTRHLDATWVFRRP